MYDIDIVKRFYNLLPEQVSYIKKKLGRPLTLSEKILFCHIDSNDFNDNLIRGESYVDFSPDRVAMQDATAQMALLQFMMAGKDRVAVPSTVHCDHLIQAKIDASVDLDNALDSNDEVYKFLESVSNKYGIGFWKPGAE